MMAELGNGLSAYGRAHKVIFQHNLSKYLVLPGIVCIVYSLIFFAVASASGAFLEVDASDLPSILSWLGAAANWVPLCGETTVSAFRLSGGRKRDPK